MRISHVFLISVDNVDPATLGICKKLFDVEPVVINQFDFRGRPAAEWMGYSDPRAFVRRYGRYPTAGQIGCALAHRECWRRLVDEGGSSALIFEDDVLVDPSINEVVLQAINGLPGWDLIKLRLDNAVVSSPYVEIAPDLRAYKASVFCGGAYSYVISNGLANRFLIQQTPKIRHYSDWPLEVWNFNLWSIDCQVTSFTHRPSSLQHSIGNESGGWGVDRAINTIRKAAFRFYKAWRIRILRDRSV